MTLIDAEYTVDINIKPSSISTSEEVESLGEQVEFLREQKNSLHQLVEHLYSKLFDKQQQIEALEQELEQTNKELCHALSPHKQEINHEIFKVEQLAQQIRQSQESVNESLATPINAVYGCAIPPKELEVEEAIATATLPNMVAKQILNKSKELITRSQQLNPKFNELGFKFIENKARFMRSQEERGRNLTEFPQQFENETIFSERLQAYQIKIEANLTQLQKHLARSRELLDASKVYVKLAKSRSVSSSNSKKSAEVNLS